MANASGDTAVKLQDAGIETINVFTEDKDDQAVRLNSVLSLYYTRRFYYGKNSNDRKNYCVRC